MSRMRGVHRLLPTVVIFVVSTVSDARGLQGVINDVEIVGPEFLVTPHTEWPLTKVPLPAHWEFDRLGRRVAINRVPRL